MTFDSFVLAGAVVCGAGLLVLTILHIMLMVRLRKLIFTFLPILFYPANELLDKERFIRRIGIGLCVIGAMPILASFLLRDSG